ncbi:unnamed protein product [Symbiodinium sp. KB8]|nr:unnamed protein product [Symbiodinium sp. KB8]
MAAPASIVFDQAFLEGLCHDDGFRRQAVVSILDPRKLGQAALIAWVSRNAQGIEKESTLAVLRRLWALPRPTQATLLQEHGICAVLEGRPHGLVGPVLPLSFDPLAAADAPLFPEGWVPLTVDTHPDCQLSRELMDAVYSHDFGTTTVKPKRLMQFSSQGLGRHLYAVVGKDDGHVYYSGTQLQRSPTALALLRSSASLVDLYARMPLLLTPSEHVPFNSAVSVAPEVMVAGHKVLDGQTEVGPSLASDLSLLDDACVNPDTGIVVYDPLQYRAWLRLENGLMSLCKGMVAINDCLPDHAVFLPKSCSKLEAAGRPQCSLRNGSGWSFTLNKMSGTERPKLNAQVLASLFMRLAFAPAQTRTDLHRTLETWLARLKNITLQRVRGVAWGLPQEVGNDPAGYSCTPLLPPTPPTAGPRLNWNDLRVLVKDIAVRYVPQVANETDVQMLDQTLPEAKPWTLQRGTKDSIILGGNRCLAKLDQLDKEPKLELAGPGCRGRAISDPWGALGPRQCHIVQQGKVLCGKVVVWRNPVMVPDDIQVWDAKPLPPDVKHVPNNAIICTRSVQQDGADGDGEAPGVLGLSGGDHDGDEVDISFDPDFVAFVTETQQFRGTEAIRRAKEETAELIRAATISPQPEFQGSYIDFCCQVPTPELKGRTCAAFERLFLATWVAPSGDRRDLLLCLACRMAHVAYAAYDTPKKFAAKVVDKVCSQILREASLPRGSPKFSDYLQANYLALDVRTDRKRPWTCLTEGTLVPRDLEPGQVWMPVPHVQLGRAAGHFLRRVLISSHGRRRQCTDGILERRAAEELIKLLKHKISPRLSNQSFHAAVLRGDAQALIGAASAAPFRRSSFSIGHLANSDL